eukprot:c32224_g1_i1 orf=1-237(-)
MSIPNDTQFQGLSNDSNLSRGQIMGRVETRMYEASTLQKMPLKMLPTMARIHGGKTLKLLRKHFFPKHSGTRGPFRKSV